MMRGSMRLLSMMRNDEREHEAPIHDECSMRLLSMMRNDEREHEAPIHDEK
jgi:hypothetical protein